MIPMFTLETFADPAADDLEIAKNSHLPSIKYRMLIAYDGTNYGGWQIQPNAISIQALIQQSLSIILRQEITIHGSGRTDAGVHALGQCAHFIVEKAIDIPKTFASLNGLLPKDIRILFLEEAKEEFHARFSARSKSYHYRLHLDPVADPFKRLYSYHVPHHVDLDLLKTASFSFLGTHDFTSFANEPGRGSVAHDAVRTLLRLDIVEESGGVRLEFQGDGFLYKMVRNITGTLLDVCAYKITCEQIPRIFIEKDRRLAGRSAPAHGLHLVEVHY